MDLEQTPNSACPVCGWQSAHRECWYLVTQNSWLDRLKILAWHPALAEQPGMHSVCGKRHLELLITHWLTYANLRFEAASIPESVLADHGYRPGEGIYLPHPGQLVGELAVHRDSMSRLWTGSPAARESILDALIGACETHLDKGCESSDVVEAMSIAFDITPPDAGSYFSERAVEQAGFVS